MRVRKRLRPWLRFHNAQCLPHQHPTDTLIAVLREDVLRCHSQAWPDVALPGVLDQNKATYHCVIVYYPDLPALKVCQHVKTTSAPISA